MLLAHGPRVVRCARALAIIAVVTLALSVVAAGPAEAEPGPSFTNPVVPAPDSADPTLVFHDGFYYYVATTWTSDVVMRRSATIAGLRSAPEQRVLQTGGNVMWAPHLEMIKQPLVPVLLGGAERRAAPHACRGERRV